MNGTSIPSARATSAIALSSVEMIARDTHEARAASHVHASNGRPPHGAMFLPGIPFEPPRAVISARTFTQYVIRFWIWMSDLVARMFAMRSPALPSP